MGMFSKVTNVDDVLRFDEVDEGIADAREWSVLELCIAGVCTYLQSLAKSIRRYMKSYLPKEETSTIFFKRGWSTLFGILRSMIYRDVRGDGDAREGGRTYGSSHVTSGDELVEVNNVVQPTRATTIPARTSTRVEPPEAVWVRKRQGVGRAGVPKLLPSEGLLLKGRGEWNAGSASRSKGVALRGVQSKEALVATSVDTSGTLLDGHTSEGTSELVVDRGCIANVLRLGQSNDDTLTRLENTTYEDGSEDGACWERRGKMYEKRSRGRYTRKWDEKMMRKDLRRW